MSGCDLELKVELSAVLRELNGPMGRVVCNVAPIPGRPDRVGCLACDTSWDASLGVTGCVEGGRQPATIPVPVPVPNLGKFSFSTVATKRKSPGIDVA